MRRGVGSENRESTPAPTSTTPVRQRLGSANAETTAAGTQAAANAATPRNMRREERATVQSPVKKRQPDGMSHSPPPPPSPKRLGHISLVSANSLALLSPISLDQRFSSAPLKSQHHRGVWGGKGALHTPPPPPRPAGSAPPTHGNPGSPGHGPQCQATPCVAPEGGREGCCGCRCVGWGGGGCGLHLRSA